VDLRRSQWHSAAAGPHARLLWGLATVTHLRGTRGHDRHVLDALDDAPPHVFTHGAPTGPASSVDALVGGARYELMF
jgi:hypothetical protein